MTASDSELDAPLLRLCAEQAALNNEINAGLHTIDGNVVDEVEQRLSDMEQRISRLPVPCTLAGVTALLRVKAACIATRWPDQTDERIVLLALSGLERLVGRAA